MAKKGVKHNKYESAFSLIYKTKSVKYIFL